MKGKRNVWLWIGALVLAYVAWRWWQGHQSQTTGTGGSSLRQNQGSAFNVPSIKGRNRRRG